MKFKPVVLFLIFTAFVSVSCTPGALLTTGATAPHFELFDTNGKTVSLSDFSGRPVMLNFWGTG